jgi:ABC-type bacteriocin/lantibiotic exporter with double-glycine peptidase domain
MENKLLQKYLKQLKIRLFFAKLIWCICLFIFVLNAISLFYVSSSLVWLVFVKLLFWCLPVLLITRDKKRLIQKDTLKPSREIQAKAALKLIEQAELEEEKTNKHAIDELKQYIDEKD